ncbi:hypothetical protein [Pseudomonas sp. NPDC086251]|uniref:hypothetical protein n=1 Tax=Pseudomonas sp. NPDC086251 TaxID=3364431 RepID=UPI003835544F
MSKDIDVYDVPGEVGPVNDDQPLETAPSLDSTDMEALPELTSDGQILDPQSYRDWADSVRDLPVGQVAEYPPGMQLPDGRVIRILFQNGIGPPPQHRNAKPVAKPARKSAMKTLLARAKKK